MIKNLHISVTISQIRNFLNRCLADVDKEMDEIEEKNENCEYEDLDDYLSHLETPFMRMEMILFAAVHELNILIEEEFQYVARVPFDEEYKGKRLWDLIFQIPKISLEDLKKSKNISDFTFYPIKDMIEKHFKINILEIENYSKILEIREITNSYKHRRKEKSIKKVKDISEIKFFSEKYSLSEEIVYDYLNITDKFLRQLKQLTIGDSPL